MDNAAIKNRLKTEAKRVENYLARCLDSPDTLPGGLRTAMEYSLLAGGKRLRPVLCLTFAAAFSSRGEDLSARVLPFAAAIECIHTYSLIHDDLPAMDNDDMRRGRPSNHKRFDEATAILAGDALLTDAFYFMASVGAGENALPPERVLAAVAIMARAAGGPGMVGGQFLDMLYTNGTPPGLDALRAMHAMKTGALLQASCLTGAVLAGADVAAQSAVAVYGKALGAAFQIMDDVLDETGDAAILGKPVGSDAANAKSTYPSLLGIEKSLDLARAEARAAVAALPEAGTQTAFLHGLAQYVVNRVQ